MPRLKLVPQSSLLQRVMAYQNREVVARFEHVLGLSHEDATQLFTDVKQFLYVCNMQPSRPTIAIDEGWHEFVLYTRDYREFCMTMFGRVIEHEPDSYFAEPAQGTKDQMVAMVSIATQAFGELSPNWRCATADCGGCSSCSSCSSGDASADGGHDGHGASDDAVIAAAGCSSGSSDGSSKKEHKREAYEDQPQEGSLFSRFMKWLNS